LFFGRRWGRKVEELVNASSIHSFFFSSSSLIKQREGKRGWEKGYGSTRFYGIQIVKELIND
jgi:hypothetical protein